MDGRKVLKITGSDRQDFLQNLITNDINRLKDGLVWTALLTPQGKYLADFFLVPADEVILLDVAESLAQTLAQRLTMYKLRADVQIEATEITPSRGPGRAPDGAFADPRHADLGWRAYDGRPDVPADWDDLRVTHMIPETGIELVPNDSYPLELDFERLNGVDFKKGCYVGQEVTARMKHKTELKKGLAKVAISGAALVGSEITTADGKAAGTLYTQSGGKALAYLRFDRATGEMTAASATITRLT
ncbi:CAF17-like 4Fe-4S cluster assembly/insertion protein YgfZ [Boseongicola aestuarii]|uniref:Putative global regulator n=1 Tax=Boseongicola aestuarii TaxID=1470561 RepID=A0A238J4U6_9RHOB|nr:folate-binding protein YgfZ [Boseongicola aestuarii]SMX25351.1 putative global regulator [Boseongicola aestuarii]